MLGDRDLHGAMRREVAGPIEPDVVLPEQFYGARAADDPCRRLMRAMLQDAIRCYQTRLFATGQREHELFAEAREWFASRDAAPFFSFENVCTVLDLDAEHVRAGLRRWRAAAEARRRTSAAGAIRDRSVDEAARECAEENHCEVA